jgi:hypothetical protein
MTFHDHTLVKRSKRGYKATLRGIREITLSPTAPHFEFGSLADDWRAVGDDMRRAMSRIESGE